MRVASDEARTRGFEVLSARCSAAESVLADTALVELLPGVDDRVVDRLPAVQRRAIAVTRRGGDPKGDLTHYR